MVEILLALSDAPIPNLLVLAGILFVFLAVARKVEAIPAIHEDKRKVLAIIGGILVVIGIAIHLAPIFEKLLHSRAVPDHEIAGTEAGIRSAIEIASRQERKATMDLDLEPVELVYEGHLLNRIALTIDTHKREGQFDVCKLIEREYHSIDFTEEAREARVEMTERWDCAHYSIEIGDCIEQYSSVRAYHQTIFLERKNTTWMIHTYDSEGHNADRVNWVSCTDHWPATWHRQ
jgi:uncharacterized protein YjeT (DUF2065 family)